MEEKKQENTTKRCKLIREFYALLNNYKFRDVKKQTVLDVYGVESLKELTIDELEFECKLMRAESNDEKSKARKRLIAAACNYCEEIGYEPYMEAGDVNTRIAIVKGLATRAAAAEEFNEISLTKLRALYGFFRTQVRVMRKSVQLVNELINNQ